MIHVPEGNSWAYNVLHRSTNLVEWTRLVDWRYPTNTSGRAFGSYEEWQSWVQANDMVFHYGTREEMNNTGIHLSDDRIIIASPARGGSASRNVFYWFEVIPWPYGNYPPFHCPVEFPSE